MSNHNKRHRQSFYPSTHNEDASQLPYDLLYTSAPRVNDNEENLDQFFERRNRKEAKRATKKPKTQKAEGPKAPAIVLEGQTATQQRYIDLMTGSDLPFIVAHGPAGTGKTYPAVLYAIQQLRAGNIKRIVITRPLVNVEEEEVGTLPGGIIEKVSPWMLPILDIFKEYYSPHELKQLLEKEIVEIAPLAFMRGRTFKNVLLIADEMQNATPNQFKMLLTRIGEGSRFIITGDVEQTDRKRDKNGLLDLTSRLDAREVVNDNRFGVITFRQPDVVRHEAIDSVLSLYA